VLVGSEQLEAALAARALTLRRLLPAPALRRHLK